MLNKEDRDLAEVSAVPMVVRAAREMARQQAEACNVNEQDLWTVNGPEFLDEAEKVIAVTGAPELLTILESILEITQEEHFIRSADSRLYEISTYARLALRKAQVGPQQ